MPDTPTTRLSLYKSLSDGSELVDYSQDLGQNWDKVDAAIGFAPCTASTRPSAPYQGKGIMQTDTAYSTFVHNGTAPASAGWIEIPNSSSVFGSDLQLAAGKKIIIGGDSNLFRDAANKLRTNDALTVDGAFTASSNASIAGSASITGNLTVTGSLAAGNITTGAAVAYTPVWSGTGVDIGNGTITGSYFLVGKLCVATFGVVCGSTTNFGSGNWTFSLPFTAATGPAGAPSTWGYSGAVRGHGAKWYSGTALVLGGANTAQIYEDNAFTQWNASTPAAWSASSSSYWNATLAYETA